LDREQQVRKALFCLFFLLAHQSRKTARVRIARHSKTGQYAAVKIIPKSAIKSRVALDSIEEDMEKALRAAEREIVVMKLIEHPNIMQMYDVWTTSSYLYLILEYADGGELFEYLCSKGQLHAQEALRIFQQIIGAVDYCHRFNICHRDLKPENILLDKEFNVKVADFGFAVWSAYDGSDGLLQTSCGSPHYAAPEVIKGLSYDGTKADIWSCGVILFALLVGKLPFDHEDHSVLLGKIKMGKFDMPTSIPAAAKDLISRMLKVDTDARITMKDIKNHSFFTSLPIRVADYELASYEYLSRPIASREDVDPYILANLRALWDDATDDGLIRGLLSEEPTWEKGVYHLLVRYRERHVEHYDPEAEHRARRRLLRHGKKRISIKSERQRPIAHRPIIVDPEPDSPASVVPEIIATQPSDDDFVHISDSSLNYRPSNVPGFASPHAPANTPIVPYIDPPAGHPQDVLCSPSLGPQGGDVTGTREFFQQVLSQLEDMAVQGEEPLPEPEADDPSIASATRFGIRVVQKDPTNILSPVLPLSPKTGARLPRGLLRDLEDVDDAEGPLSLTGAIDRALFSSVLSPQPVMDGLSPEEALARPEPLASRRRSRKPAPLKLTSSANDKENRPFRPFVDKTDGGEMSPNPTTGGRPALGERRIQFEPTTRPDRLSPHSIEAPSPGLTDCSSAPTTPLLLTPLEAPSSATRNSWFTNHNPFKLKAATYELLSISDAADTRHACVELLQRMGVSVQSQSPDGSLALRCELPEMRDPAGQMGVLRAVRFRVELRAPSAQQAATGGFVTIARLVQEKGSLASFKMVFNRLRREWELDSPGKPWGAARNARMSLDVGRAQTQAAKIARLSLDFARVGAEAPRIRNGW
jgi:serine/threonine-protein kinase HSL1, negative regulator of Swe1 kinase